RGTGAAVIGDYIVTSAHDPERGLEQQVGPDDRVVGNIVYKTELPASQVTQAKVAAMDPRLTVISTMGIERSEEHTSELHSRFDIVCRLLHENKNSKTCQQLK